MKIVFTAAVLQPKRSVMKISVIVPVYNCEKYLRKCLDSISVQTYADWECIIVDDGSKDGSPAICDEYAANDSRFKVIHKENGGLSSARNAALEIAKGDYVAFCDSDDYYMSEFLETMVNLAIKSGKDVCMCGYFFVDEDGNITDSKTEQNESFVGIHDQNEFVDFVFAKHGFPNYVCNKAFNRSIFETVRFPEGLTYEDANVMPQIADISNGIAVSNYSGYAYFRYRSGNISSTVSNLNSLCLIKNAEIKCRLSNAKYNKYFANQILHYINASFGARLKHSFKNLAPTEQQLLDDNIAYLNEINKNHKSLLPSKSKIILFTILHMPKFITFAGKFIKI